MRKCYVLAVALAMCGYLLAEGEAPPLPFHTIEGTSGVFTTPVAYLANPAKEGEVFGRPSVSTSAAFMRHLDLQSFAITENLFGNIEVGYALERLGFSDWAGDVKTATGYSIDHHVEMHNFNLRAMVVPEGSFGCEWMPAITIGSHFKWNDGIADINRQMNGTVDFLGSDRSWGTEFTVVASKTVADVLPWPVIVSGGLRNTDAIHTGLMGFAGERKTVFEGSAIVLFSDRLLFAAEYKQKPDLLDHRNSGGLIYEEDDWWVLCLGYIIDENTTLAVGYGIFGNLLNSREDNVFAVQIKYEF